MERICPFCGSDNRKQCVVFNIVFLLLTFLFIGIMGIAIISSIALTIKRLHDRNKSAWWFLLAFVPVFGALWYLVEVGFLPGTQGANKYGEQEAVS